MRYDKGMLHRLMQGVDLPAESIPGNSLVEVVGRKRVLIEFHFGICAYSRCEICVRIKPGVVRICGTELELLRITKQQLVVCGKIDSICFDDGGL